MAQTNPLEKSKSQSRLTVLMVGSTLLIGLSLIGGYIRLFGQTEQLKTALAQETEAKNKAIAAEKKAEDALAEKLKAEKAAQDNAALVKQATPEIIDDNVTASASVPTGKGWIFLCKFSNGKWSSLTLDNSGLTSPEEFANKTVKVKDSVYIRKDLPTVERRYALGLSIGVARLGQSVSLGKVAQGRPGSWYAEVLKVTGTPAGDKSLGSGFFKVKNPGLAPSENPTRIEETPKPGIKTNPTTTIPSREVPPINRRKTS